MATTQRKEHFTTVKTKQGDRKRIIKSSTVKKPTKKK